MKITTNLTHIATAVEFEPAVTEDALKAKFEEFGVQGFEAELDIAERTEDHVQMVSLDTLLGFAKASGVAAVTYDVTFFPHADDAEVEYQLKQLARDLEIAPEVFATSALTKLRNILSLTPNVMLRLPCTALLRHMLAVPHSLGTASMIILA